MVLQLNGRSWLLPICILLLSLAAIEIIPNLCLLFAPKGYNFGVTIRA